MAKAPLLAGHGWVLLGTCWSKRTTVYKIRAHFCTPQMELVEPVPGRPSPCVTLGNCYDLLKGASLEDLARSLGPKFVLVELLAVDLFHAGMS